MVSAEAPDHQHLCCARHIDYAVTGQEIYLKCIKLVVSGRVLQRVLIIAGQAARRTPGRVHPVVIKLCSIAIVPMTSTLASIFSHDSQLCFTG